MHGHYTTVQSPLKQGLCWHGLQMHNFSHYHRKQLSGIMIHCPCFKKKGQNIQKWIIWTWAISPFLIMGSYSHAKSSVLRLGPNGMKWAQLCTLLSISKLAHGHKSCILAICTVSLHIGERSAESGNIGAKYYAEMSRWIAHQGNFMFV